MVGQAPYILTSKHAVSPGSKIDFTAQSIFMVNNPDQVDSVTAAVLLEPEFSDFPLFYTEIHGGLQSSVDYNFKISKDWALLIAPENVRSSDSLLCLWLAKADFINRSQGDVFDAKLLRF